MNIDDNVVILCTRIPAFAGRLLAALQGTRSAAPSLPAKPFDVCQAALHLQPLNSPKWGARGLAAYMYDTFDEIFVLDRIMRVADGMSATHHITRASDARTPVEVPAD